MQIYKIEIDDLEQKEAIFLKQYLLSKIECGEIPYALQDCITIYKQGEAPNHWVEV